MLERMAACGNRVEPEDWEAVLAQLRELARRISQEEIYRYYP